MNEEYIKLDGHIDRLKGNEMLSKWEQDKVGKRLQMRMYGTAVNPRKVLEIQTDRKVWGREIKGIDLGRLSEDEYQAFCKENKVIPFKM